MDTSRTSDEATFDRVYESETGYRDLKFGELALTDDDAYLQKDQLSVGEITVTVWQCKLAGYEDFIPVEAVAGPSKVHERANKALAHSVTFGEVNNDAVLAFTANIVDISAEPLAAFTFRYRSLDTLRANGIAPTPESQPTQTESQSRSPTPGPSGSGSGSGSRGEKRSASRTLSRGPEDVKPDIVDLEELEDVEARVRKAEEALRRARFEVQQRKGNKRIKLEDVPAFVSGETIDLTED
ncbi:uncharacterized protein SCHCODRAFT_02556108 [Schizophyllum commune H4-8]|uniref:Expressed protein n=1 Tax=Schizophyllum commune (strain H4-8 / FGSC 9210) TaxID=578458 RepID=D8QI45_SCHCM|nr:uncharacterized protein SCHCODRAFT_02556108 [Schizophyllum commune H4-8]KAI5885853.1 hypothetical protein SCHCODRAFT_02556108 [Schizophyllum commune H4-8]